MGICLPIFRSYTCSIKWTSKFSLTPQIFRPSGISVRSDFFHKGFNLKCALLSTTNCAVLWDNFNFSYCRSFFVTFKKKNEIVYFGISNNGFCNIFWTPNALKSRPCCTPKKANGQAYWIVEVDWRIFTWSRFKKNSKIILNTSRFPSAQ